MVEKEKRTGTIIEDLKRIEYPAVLERITSYSQLEGGKAKIASLLPSTDKKEIEKRFDLIEEIESSGIEIDFENLKPLEGIWTKLKGGEILEPAELQKLANALKEFSRLKKILNKANCPLIKSLVAGTQDFLPLIEKIESSVDEGGIKDEASPELKKIREEIRSLREYLLEKLKEIARKKTSYFQEIQIYFRNQRYVLPLKREYESKYKGIVVDYSDTQNTAFVEPFETVKLNNQLKYQKTEEKEEEKRIIKKLNKEVKSFYQDLKKIITIIIELDFLNALRRFKETIRGIRPEITEGDELSIIEGKHPLLMEKREVVPLSLTLPPTTYTLLISGPNAGGKTVALKTTGLLSSMALSGIPIPAAPGTRIPLFSQIFVDLGDEQSIEKDISTFTGHLLNIKRIIEMSTNDSLILLDEVGTSTSPNEGAALGMAVLEELKKKGSKTIATSHLEPLKIFIEQTEGMVNGNMGWNDGPTYKLNIGMPGTSNALKVAQSLGFSPSILEKAKSYADEKIMYIEELIQELTKQKNELKEELKRLENIKLELKDKEGKYKRLIQTLQSNLNDIKRRYKEKMYKELKATRKEIEQIVKRIKESHASKESVVKAKQYFEEKLSKIEKALQKEPPNKHEFKVGERVLIQKWGKEGIVESLSAKGNVMVNFGNKRIELTKEELQSLPSKEKEKVRPFSDYYFNPVLDIRGHFIDEAELKVINFIEEASSLGVEKVWIIHGKGKGLLRNMVRELAEKDTKIKNITAGEPKEGGDGVSVIWLC